MALSSELISQFVKSTKDATETKQPSTIYGTVVYDGKTYVKLDGSELLTPVSTTVNVTDGDRVTVQIQNHTATITGNVTDPSASGKKADELSDQISEFETVIAYKVKAEEIDAVNATIDQLKADLARIDKLEATEAEIETLEATYAELDSVQAKDVEALNAIIENLEVIFGQFTDIETEDLEALTADINQLKAYNADFTYVSADQLHAMKAEIDNLDVGGLTAEEADIRYAQIKDLEATNANINVLTAGFGELEQLVTEDLEAAEADIKELHAVIFDAESGNIKFANIDFSNITEAAIEKIFADSGFFKDITSSEGTFTKELVGVKITGDVIDANTIKAENLILQGPDGIYYKLNTIAGEIVTEKLTEEELQNGLSGKAIIAKTITAEKIAVDDLVAFDATIGGFNITENSLYSGVKESVNNTTRGVYLDNDGQIAFGDAGNYIKYYKDSNGTYRLAIAAKSIIMGATGRDVVEVVEDIESTVKASVITFVGEYVRTTTDEVVYFVSNEDTGEVTYFCEVVELTDDTTITITYQVTETEGIYTKTDIATEYTLQDGIALETHPEAPYKQGDIWVTAGGYSKYCILKSEGEFSESDWTDTAEDELDSIRNITDDISDISAIAENAKAVAAENTISVGDITSRLEILENRLRSLIIDDEGNSLLDQSGESFSFSFLNNNMEMSNLSKAIEDIDSMLNEIEGSETVDSYIRYIKVIELDNTESACLELGAKNSPFKIQITNDTVRFIDSTCGIYTNFEKYTTTHDQVFYYYDESGDIGYYCNEPAYQATDVLLDTTNALVSYTPIYVQGTSTYLTTVTGEQILSYKYSGSDISGTCCLKDDGKYYNVEEAYISYVAIGGQYVTRGSIGPQNDMELVDIVEIASTTNTGEQVYRGTYGNETIYFFMDDNGDRWLLLEDQFVKTTTRYTGTHESYELKEELKYKLLKEPLARFGADSMHINNAVIDTSLNIGNFEYRIRSNGNVGILWKGDDE